MQNNYPRLILLGAIDTPCYIRVVARFSHHDLAFMIHKDLTLPQQDDSTRFQIVTENTDIDFLSTQHVHGFIFNKPLVYDAEHVDENATHLLLHVPDIKTATDHVRTVIGINSDKVEFACPEDVNVFMHQKSPCFRNKGYTRQ